jgi:hypothetical protein
MHVDIDIDVEVTEKLTQSLLTSFVILLKMFLQLTYSLITGPAIVALDASGSPEEVLETAVQCLEHHHVFIRDDSPAPLPAFTSADQGAGRSDYDMPTDESHEQYIAGEEYADNRKSAASSRRSSMYGGGRENKRQSMGVYGAMLKMDW